MHRFPQQLLQVYNSKECCSSITSAKWEYRNREELWELCRHTPTHAQQNLRYQFHCHRTTSLHSDWTLNTLTEHEQGMRHHEISCATCWHSSARTNKFIVPTVCLVSFWCLDNYISDTKDTSSLPLLSCLNERVKTSVHEEIRKLDVFMRRQCQFTYQSTTAFENRQQINISASFLTLKIN